MADKWRCGLCQKVFDSREEAALCCPRIAKIRKTVIVNGMEFVPSLTLCNGCPELTVAEGWQCFYKPDTQECAYPEHTMQRYLQGKEKGQCQHVYARLSSDDFECIHCGFKPSGDVSAQEKGG